MPFRGVSVMGQRAKFVSAAMLEGSNIRALCRAYGFSPTTGYKWLDRVSLGTG
jgi:transposase-like protein